MKRVMIIGASGSGKTTTARILGDITGLPVIHIDPMYYSSGWTQRTRDETFQMIVEAISRKSWIFEGNFSSSFAERAARSDAFVFLDFPTYLRLWRVIVRTTLHYGQTRYGSADGCPERFDWDFLKFVVGYRKRSRHIALKAMKNAPKHVECFHLKSPRDVRDFLDEMVKRYDKT